MEVRNSSLHFYVERLTQGIRAEYKHSANNTLKIKRILESIFKKDYLIMAEYQSAKNIPKHTPLKMNKIHSCFNRDL